MCVRAEVEVPHLLRGRLPLGNTKKKQKKRKIKGTLSSRWMGTQRGGGKGGGGSLTGCISLYIVTPPPSPLQGALFWRFLFNARISHISHLDGAANATSAGAEEKRREQGRTAQGAAGGRREMGGQACVGQSFYRFAA